MLIYKITNKIKGSKIFNKVLPEYKYLVNTVLSSDNEKV